MALKIYRHVTTQYEEYVRLHAQYASKQQEAYKTTNSLLSSK